MRVGISGTGRIGRLCLRNALSRKDPNLEIKVVNSTCPAPALAHLLQFDTVHGRWDAAIEAEGDDLLIDGKRIAVVTERAPELLPWGKHDVDLVIDATGKFTDRSGMERHLFAGARRVLITSPGKSADLTVVMGVNEDRYDPDRHRLLSAASCTTNCLAPILFIMDEAFGVKCGWMTTVHAYTNDQNHLDNPHHDLRRARSCTNSIIPTTTGVGKALADVLPRLSPCIHGVSIRVPVQDVSLLDLQLQLNRPAEAAEVKTAFKQAAAGKLGAYVAYNELPLVSADYIGSDKSAIIDGLSMMAYGDQIKLLAWYDNEWAYACRVIDFAGYIARAECGNQRGGERQCLTSTT